MPSFPHNHKLLIDDKTLNRKVIPRLKIGADIDTYIPFSFNRGLTYKISANEILSSMPFYGKPGLLNFNPDEI